MSYKCFKYTINGVSKLENGQKLTKECQIVSN